MASRLNPYLNFPGNAREALEFYREVFSGELELAPFGDFGMPNSPGPDKIMHGRLETASGFTLMGADTTTDTEHKPGNNIAVSLSGDDVAELRGYWAKLADEGTVVIPLEKQMWGDEFGMCADKFGITWLVNIISPEG